MPVEQVTSVAVTCDNPNCPNVDNLPEGLTNDSMTGWLIVSIEEYAVGTIKSGTFCSWECVTAGDQPTVEAPSLPVMATPIPLPTSPVEDATA